MKKTIIYGAMGLGLIVTGCQDNNLPEGSEISNDRDRTFYVSVNIHGDVAGATRGAKEDGNPDSSTDFDAGTGESNISKAYFVFYDIDGNALGDPAEVDLSTAQWTTDNKDGETVEKYYQSVVGITVQNGAGNPAQVICYINPENLDNLTLPISDIQEATRKVLYTENAEGTKFFPMSNSVFYTNTSSEAPQIAVQIAPNQLFNTREAANQALSTGARTVNVFVERYAAKLTFSYAEPTLYETVSRTIAGNTETSIGLSFVPKTWMLNAQCEDTYVVKSYREENSTGVMLDDNYGYQELDAVINKGLTGDNVWKWNNASYNRSYWGMSPAYFTSEYPEVSSDVAGITSLNQKYYTYEELINGTGGNALGFTLPTAGSSVTQYVHETTVGSKALASKNIVAALASVILVGDYTVTINGTDYTGIDFYTYGVVSADNPKPLVYFDVQNGSLTGESAYTGTESIIRGLLYAATNLYKQVTENGEVKYVNFDITNQTDLEKLINVLQVEAPSDVVKGNLKVPERYRTLQFKTSATSDQLKGIYVGTAEGYKTVATSEVTTPSTTQLTLIQANQELMKVVGYAAKYNAGAAYFNIPVKHYGWYRKGNPNNAPNATMDWSKVLVGDFGVVRNHSYAIDVTAITGLGTGIGDPGNPIVPPAEENRYYIAYSVNILKWAVVPTQSTVL